LAVPFTEHSSKKVKVGVQLTQEMLALIEEVRAPIPLITKHQTYAIALRLGLELLRGDPQRLLKEALAGVSR
jgi:hypothetical protein